MDKAKGTLKQGTELPRSDRPTAGSPTLRKLGISKEQSSDWQKLAVVPSRQFEAALASPEMPTTSGILAEGRHQLLRSPSLAKQERTQIPKIGSGFQRRFLIFATPA